MGSSPDFDLAVMKTAHENAIASLVSACRNSARYQHRAEVAEAALGKVRTLATLDATDGTVAASILASIRAAMKEPKP